MAAVGIRLRAELRSRWRAWVALAILAGALGAFVVALWAGADRTSQSYRHYLRATNAADAYVDPGIGFGDDTLDLTRVARLPQVVYSEQQLIMAVVSRSRSGRPALPSGPDSVQYQVPSDGRRVDRIDRQKILEGRLPDPSRADEALADTKSLRTLGLHLGDTLALRSPTQRVLTSGLSSLHLTDDPLTTRVGPLVRVRIVGVAANARSDVDGGLIRLTSGFYRRYGGLAIGHFLREFPVRLRHGAADLSAFHAGVDRIAGKRAYGFFEPSQGRPQLQRSIDLLAGALRLLALAAAIAAIVLVGQGLLRDAARDLPAQPVLRAVGMTRSQLVKVGALRAVAIGVAAAAITVPVAFLLSPLAPVGRAGELEPDPGFFFDASVVLPGAAIVLSAVVLLGVLGTARVVVYGSGAQHPAAAGLGRRMATAAGRIGLPPSATAGVRMALVRRSRSSAVPVRATLVAAVLAVAVTVTAVTFATSLDRLLHTPALYGQTWDFESGLGPDIPASELRSIARDPGVAALAAGTVTPVEIGGHPVGARATDGVKGSIWPTLLDGRSPRGRDDVVIGPKTSKAVHKGIGDTLVLRRGRHGITLRVVGIAAFPSTKFNKLGDGAALSFRTLKRIAPSEPAGTLEVRLAPGPAGRAAQARLVGIFDGTIAVRPQEVGDFAGVNGMPFIIAALFAAAAIAVLGHALVTSVRRRRRDIAILKTLGFTRGQVAAAIAWQATTIAAIGLLVGIPLGLLAGRFAWNEFAHQLGVVPDPTTPVGLAVLVIPAAVLLANAIAALPGFTAARTQPALVLRAE